jgi:hypothetical protein
MRINEHEKCGKKNRTTFFSVLLLLIGPLEKIDKNELLEP